MHGHKSGRRRSNIRKPADDSKNVFGDHPKVDVFSPLTRVIHSRENKLDYNVFLLIDFRSLRSVLSVRQLKSIGTARRLGQAPNWLLRHFKRCSKEGGSMTNASSMRWRRKFDEARITLIDPPIDLSLMKFSEHALTSRSVMVIVVRLRRLLQKYRSIVSSESLA